MATRLESLAVGLVMCTVVLLALGVFGAASFLLLQAATNLPVWAAVAVSVPIAIGGFVLFTWTHQTNGFDGPMVPIDEFKERTAAMSPWERSVYLSKFSDRDRQMLEQQLGTTGNVVRPSKD
jgi:hypothetical protein